MNTFNRDAPLDYFKEYFRVKKYKNYLTVIDITEHVRTFVKYKKKGLKFKTTFMIGKDKIFCEGFVVVLATDVHIFNAYHNKTKTMATKDEISFSFGLLDSPTSDEILYARIDAQVVKMHLHSYRKMFKFGETI